MVSDGRHQTRPDWFLIQRITPTTLIGKDKNISENAKSGLNINKVIEEQIFFESNARLNVAPGILAQITSDILKAKIDNVK